MKYIYAIALLGSLCAGMCKLRAQTGVQEVPGKLLALQNAEHREVMQAFSNRFAHLDSLFEALPAVPGDRVLGGGKILSNQLIDSIYRVRWSYQRKAFVRKTGFELSGQAYYRLDDALSFDEESGQYSRYTAKLQAEAGWNFFNSSFYQRKSGLQLLALTRQLDGLQQLKQWLELSWDDAALQVEEQCRRRLRGVLAEQLDNLSVLDRAYRFALARKRAGSDKLMEVMAEQLRVERALAEAGGVPGEAACGGLQQVVPTVLAVDTAALWPVLLAGDLDVRAAGLRMEKAAVERRLTNYARDMRLTPFVRASYYFRSALPSSANVEAGVRFSLPLYGGAAAKRKALSVEETLAGMDQVRFRDHLQGQCRRLLLQLDRLNKAVEAEHRHATRLREFMALRREAYQESAGGYNHVARLEEYNQYLRSLERMYVLLRERGLCLLRMQQLAGTADIRPVLVERRIGQ